MYNVYVIPFWPMKVYWFMRKTVQLVTINDFPEPPENHPDLKISRSYFPTPSFLKH
jgi:hypothetical protein